MGLDGIVRLRVSRWVIHYAYESPYKDSRRQYVYVCVREGGRVREMERKRVSVYVAEMIMKNHSKVKFQKLSRRLNILL